jgi:glycosyltransferase involved in cell wall biosynthesis
MENTPDTLVVLTPGFPRNEEDTTCLPAQQLFIKTINQRFPKLKIFIISFQYPFIKSSYLWHGNRVISLGGGEKGKWVRLSVWLRAWREIKKIKKHAGILGLLSFWCTECAFIGKYFGKFHSLKNFIWILGQDARKDNKYVSLIRPEPQQLIAMSDFLAKEFYKNHGIRPAHVIPNGISFQEPNGTLTNRDIDILGVGSLIPLKQYDVFIELVNELKDNFPSLKVMICGKGPEENRLQLMVQKLGLDKVVLLTGEKAHPEVLKLMKRSKVLLHTSNYEGFSTVCLEALYAGAQVVSFCKPMDEWVRHWYIANNEDEMQEMVLDILNNPSTEFTPVKPYLMEESAAAIIKLFIYH